MNRRPDFGEGVFRPHRAAPDLGVVKEKQLIVGHIEAGEQRLLPVLCHPLVIRLKNGDVSRFPVSQTGTRWQSIEFIYLFRLHLILLAG